jgi:hypothetical protein
MLAKLQRANGEQAVNVWVDPLGYQTAVAEREQAFEAELARQQQ